VQADPKTEKHKPQSINVCKTNSKTENKPKVENPEMLNRKLFPQAVTPESFIIGSSINRHRISSNEQQATRFQLKKTSIIIIIRIKRG
jgi:hypothetical protein